MIAAPERLDRPGIPRMSSAFCCLWCGRSFPARRGGSPKRFCSAAHRVEFWSALRRWGERAVAAGALTVDQIRNGVAEACTPLSSGISPAPISPAEKPALMALAGSADEAGELLDEFLIALLEMPDDAWSDLVAALPDQLYDRIDRYLETRLS
jgi:hypothetical protein